MVKYLILLVILIAPYIKGATNTAASLSSSDVQTSINNASVGDTILLPSGSATWSSGVALNKPITIHGEGTNLTIITSSGPTLFTLTATSKTVLTRLSGVQLNVNGAGT